MKTTSMTPLLAAIALVAALIAMPVGSVLTNIFSGGTGEVWRHLASTVLPEYVGNTLWLCFGVGAGVLIVGVATAWLTAMCEFPGRRFFEWALVLPLAAPAYVLAYVYTDFLQFVGPVQSALRETFGWTRADYWFPDVRSLGGAMAMFVCVLYPYVYLLARTAFIERASGMLEAARTLGYGPWRSFFRVSLPLARPAVATGVTLALMETLADYGTVSYFGVQTFTTGIYRAWFSLGDRIAAAQLAAALLAFVMLFLVLEQMSRGRARFHNTTGRNRPLGGMALKSGAALLAMLACALPLVAGFALPAGLLLHMALTQGDAQFGGHFVTLARNSFVLAGLTAVVAVGLALLLAYGGRLSKGIFAAALNRLVSLGYAVPGSVIAVGVLIPVTRLDHVLAAQWQSWFGHNPGLLLTGGIAALVYAYLVRFLAVALQAVSASLAKVTPSMDEAARSLGASQGETLRRVHLPIVRGGLLTSALLVFVDVMKELPATLVMRPFNFDTLATQAYTLASDERLAEASTAALAIVVVGILPLIFLSRQIAASRRE
ncbi:ABC transporter permease [Propionivibrio limicola]|uniref:ABC transporter permease n=1 Tax=Propionivibrio limicola TaxID=167645 RepID=UPI001290A43F|nr:iron ABC transporter permease [Propionivibrio limicola]